MGALDRAVGFGNTHHSQSKIHYVRSVIDYLIVTCCWETDHFKDPGNASVLIYT
jgi:hypothetical protein